MTKQERSSGEWMARRDRNLESMLNKADRANTLILQSLFDRQIQEYVHTRCRVPIGAYDRWTYRLNSSIIHHPSDYDGYPNLCAQHRFISGEDDNDQRWR